MSGSELSIERKLRAPRALLWQACTVPKHVAAWQADAVRGKFSLGETLSLRWPALRVEVELEVLEVEPERRLVLQNGELRTQFLFEDDCVQVQVSGISDSDAREGTASSWHLSLAMLDHYLTHHFDKPRQTTWLLRRSKTSALIAHTFFTEPQALKAWLAVESSGLGPTGNEYLLDLGASHVLRGKVLASVPERDVLVSVSPTSECTLAFRTFPSPYGEHERVIALTWSRWGNGSRGSEDGALHALLEAGVDRLGGLLGRTAVA